MDWCLRSGEYSEQGFHAYPEGSTLWVYFSKDIIDSEAGGEPFRLLRTGLTVKHIPFKREGNIYTFQLPYSVADSLGLYDN